ncbi:MAG: ATP-binding protein [Desulfobacca sp.]|uniref:ATP-binding protein n=1 Tax=Desulfobacca sp. TaxID=2067990 RepID=UPI004049ADA1
MWKKLSLQSRIFILLGALILTAVAGGLVTVWHTDAIDSLITALIDQHVASYQAAVRLESALLRQKGYVTYFSLDQDPAWLNRLEEHHQDFLTWLGRAKASASTLFMTELLDQIAAAYEKYKQGREQVIASYQQEQRQAGAEEHRRLRQQFQELFLLCDRYKNIHARRIAEAKLESRFQAKLITNTVLFLLPSIAALGLLLGYTLVKQILGPIRQMLVENNPVEPTNAPLNEVQALSQRVHTLREDVDLAQSQLKRSQVTLVQSEKLAMVGKLAAGVAHSIRNPLTSVKMRLYSMRRHLNLTQEQQEDLEVISQEIRHIDTIVRNFLEYSRPPKLKMQQISPSTVVDWALTLLRPRLESFRVTVTRRRRQPLPEIWADPDQLKEVLVNLMVNACEAMGKNGHITIIEEEDFIPGIGRVVQIRLQDTGPGIPPAIQEKIFQPFFSSKEEGTGLGLSIAARIMAEHGGSIRTESRPGQGATLILTLPLRRIRYGNHLDS